MDQFLNQWRLRTYPRLLFVALYVPLLITMLVGSGASAVTGRLGGDFPAFYGAGTVVNESGFDDIYDLDRLTEAQVGLFGDAPPELLPFFYPPFVAHLDSFLALLPYRGAYAVHTGVMVAAVAGSILLLRQLLGRVQDWSVEAFALAATFYPLYRSIGGGQNSALTLLLIVGGYRAQAADRPVLAGALAGLLLYKPQFALPVIGLFLVLNWRSILGTAASGAALWAWAAVLSGPGWVGSWLGSVRTIDETVGPLTPWWGISFPGLFQKLFGDDSIIGLGLGLTAAGVLALVLIWVWRRQEVDLDLKIAAMTCGTLLIPLHVLWYEAGLLVLPWAILANRHGRDALGRLTGLAALGLAAAAVPTYSAVPLITATLLTALWLATDIRQQVGGDVGRLAIST